MVAAPVSLDVYVREVRKQVCSRCTERPSGGPPCQPGGKVCGVENHLAELIEVLHTSSPGERTTSFLDQIRTRLCDPCPEQHSTTCPCPMDYLAAMVVEAIETVDRGEA